MLERCYHTCGKGLIEERGRLNYPASPALRHHQKFSALFRINDLSELPPLPKNENAEESTAEQIPPDEETAAETSGA
ncbi:MAG: hypothetical protein ACLR56_14360 [Oscillospiraceae bacterium]